MTYKPKIKIIDGHVDGYGGPGYYWTKGVHDNIKLYYIQGRSASDVAVAGERERVKWEKSWRSEDAFRKATAGLPHNSPICANCDLPCGERTSYCLDKTWCQKTVCRGALDAAIEQSKKDRAENEQKFERQLKQQRLDRIAEISEAVKGFHYRDGWFFRRLDDGSVRVMHRHSPDSEYLSTDLVIDPLSWASIICSVSKGGETGERWDASQDFHGR